MQRRTWRQFFFDHLTDLSLFLMAALLLGVVLFPFMVVNVPSGNVGLLWLRFRGGTVLDPRQLKNEGLRIKAPWNEVFLYDLRLQSTTDTYNAIARDGVSLTATINTRYRLKPDAIPQLHQSIGPNYLVTLVRPSIGSRMREVIADYTAEEVYSTKRQEIQDRIRAGVEAGMGEKMMERAESEDYEAYKTSLASMINLVDTLVLNIDLPDSIVTAINRKIEQYYISEEYTFRIEREKKESERKKIEAQGVRDFQQIVTQGISDSYLRWRGIEATLQLAQSPNAKTVIIGSGKEGLPIILGNVDAPRRLPRHRRRATKTPNRTKNDRPDPDNVVRESPGFWSDNSCGENARFSGENDAPGRNCGENDTAGRNGNSTVLLSISTELSEYPSCARLDRQNAAARHLSTGHIAIE